MDPELLVFGIEGLASRCRQTVSEGRFEIEAAIGVVDAGGLDDQGDIIDAYCQAWNAVADDAERIMSRCCRPRMKRVDSK